MKLYTTGGKVVVRILLLFISINLMRCSNPVEPAVSSNLLLNPSFSFNGKPSLANWDVMNASLEYFSPDFPLFPPSSVKWSLAMHTLEAQNANFIALGMVSQNVKLLNGKHVYTLSFWAKNDSINSGGGEIQVPDAGAWKYDKGVNVLSSSWSKYYIVDTLSSDQFSSVKIILLGGPTYGKKGNTLFAQCRLTAM